VVRSDVNSFCGGYPIGSGIIFTSDTISAFDSTTPFHFMTIDQYKTWRENRKKNNKRTSLKFNFIIHFSIEGV
jgi:hypothetical protein